MLSANFTPKKSSSGFLPKSLFRPDGLVRFEDMPPLSLRRILYG